MHNPERTPKKKTPLHNLPDWLILVPHITLFLKAFKKVAGKGQNIQQKEEKLMTGWGWTHTEHLDDDVDKASVTRGAWPPLWWNVVAPLKL